MGREVDGGASFDEAGFLGLAGDDTKGAETTEEDVVALGDGAFAGIDEVSGGWAGVGQRPNWAAAMGRG